MNTNEEGGKISNNTTLSLLKQFPNRITVNYDYAVELLEENERLRHDLIELKNPAQSKWDNYRAYKELRKVFNVEFATRMMDNASTSESFCHSLFASLFDIVDWSDTLFEEEWILVDKIQEGLSNGQ